jgi:hypothetical protein
MLGHRKLYDEENPTYREALAAAEAARRLPLPPGVDADIYHYDVAQAAIGDPDPKEIDWAFVAAKVAYQEMRRSHAFSNGAQESQRPGADTRRFAANKIQWRKQLACRARDINPHGTAK